MARAKKRAKKRATKPKTVAKPAKKPAKKPAASTKAKALHRKAIHTNWDDGLDQLQAIVDHPDCDHGTALAIYWLGAPGYDQQYKSADDVTLWRGKTYRFLKRLAKRLLARKFKTSLILFNPRFDRTTVSSTGHDWTAEYADIPKRVPIPAALMEPSCADPDWEARARKPIANTANRLT